MDYVSDYRFLLALHLKDISKRYGALYYDILKSQLSSDAQAAYTAGLNHIFEYMNKRHGLNSSDMLAIHETVIETLLTEFVMSTVEKVLGDKPELLH